MAGSDSGIVHGNGDSQSDNYPVPVTVELYLIMYFGTYDEWWKMYWLRAMWMKLVETGWGRVIS